MIRKFSYILNKKQKINLLWLCFIIIIGALLELLSVSAIMPIVYILLDPHAINDNWGLNLLYELGNFEDTTSFSVFIMLGVVLIYVVKNIFLGYRNYLQYAYVNNTQKEIAEIMMKSYIAQPYIFHAQNNSASIQRNIIQDVGNFVAFILAFIDLLVNAFLCIFLAIYLLSADLFITISLLVIFGVFGLFFMKPYNKLLTRYGNESREAGEKMIQWIYQALGGIKEVKILGKEEFFNNCFSKEFGRSAKAQKMSQFLSGIPGLVMETMCIGVIVLIVMSQILVGSETKELIPILSAIAYAGMKLLGAFKAVTASISRMMYLKPSLDAVYNEMKNIAELKEEKDAKETMSVQYSEDGNIVIENVCFRYPQSEKLILDNISLTIKKGQSVAFIGESGAGKTTLADIILGILLPNEGRVRINYMDSFNENWKNIFGYIPQNIYILDDSIRSNIAFGESDIDDKKVWKVLEEVQLKEYVESLPDGLYTKVGEAGARMSGGQKQRIGIARALYFEPKVLILDEATSALDNKTENAVMDAIGELCGRLTIIIIAHRLTTIQNCDCIYEVSQQGIIKINKDDIEKKIRENR